MNTVIHTREFTYYSQEQHCIKSELQVKILHSVHKR